MTSGELLKYRKGLCIAGRYGTHLSGSSQFGLTLPSGELLKYRKGLCIAGGYGTPVSGSSQFGLTLPISGPKR
jgi:hypothetical protein